MYATYRLLVAGIAKFVAGVANVICWDKIEQLIHIEAPLRPRGSKWKTTWRKRLISNQTFQQVPPRRDHMLMQILIIGTDKHHNWDTNISTKRSITYICICHSTEKHHNGDTHIPTKRPTTCTYFCQSKLHTHVFIIVRKNITMETHVSLRRGQLHIHILVIVNYIYVYGDIYLYLS